MFKNKTLLTLCFLFVAFITTAQNRDTKTRTSATRIADLLAQMPAASAAQLDELMQEMGTFGESELIDITAMLTAPGMGNDSQVRFAIDGFSNFVMKEGKSDSRRLCVSAWCKALDLAKDKEIKAFMISQIQITGTAEAVPCLTQYLTDERLCDPAARALVVINTPGAGEVLLNAMNNANGQQRVTLAQALGDIRNANAVESLTKLVVSGDLITRKAALYALGNIGAEQSGKLLYGEAKKAGFNFEPSRAASSYMRWLDRTGENGNSGLVKKQTEALIRECTADNQVQSRTEALSLLVRYTGEKSLPRLLSAADVPNAAYRNAALQLTNGLKGEKVTTGWIKKAGKLKDQSKADVITMLGGRGDLTAFTFVVSSLSDPSKQVRLSAIASAQRLGEGKSLSYLLEFMKKADAEEIMAVKQALLSMHGENVVSEIGTAMPGLNSQAKIALIEVLAARRASDYIQIVLNQVNAGDPAVKSAAIIALSSLVKERDLPELFRLLTLVSQPKDIAAVQNAILAALQGIVSSDIKSGIIVHEMNKAKGAQQSRFYAMLSELGAKNALTVVKKIFTNGSPENKDAAFKAICNWKDPDACYELFNVITGRIEGDYADSAFTAYVKMVKNATYPADQKLLLFRKAMEFATTTAQKGMILDALENVRTFTALVFAGRYLDDPLLQSSAANTVMRIALADTSFYGDVTTELLTRAMGKLKGSESDYNREAIRKYLASRPRVTGFVPLFNGKDLAGWKGLVENPVLRAKMNPKELEKKQIKADEIMQKSWSVQDGVLMFSGNGENLCTTKTYGDFEMLVDWKITSNGDAGIYLRGSPQVQIWDASRLDTEAKVGSGGLYNNMVNERNPMSVADNRVGDWNTFRIKMLGERVTVFLNGQLVVNNVIMENYWDRSIPIFPVEQIELQAHGSLLGYRDIYVREIPRPEPYQVTGEERSAGFRELFDGMSLFSWTGNTRDYLVEEGNIVFHPNNGGSGNLYTREEYKDFILRFDFQLTPAGNSGIGIRAPLEGDAAYVGMEIQVLDDGADVYKNLQPYQYHGSVYGVIPAKRGYLKPVGEWNSEEISIQGNKIKVTLNGTVIVDGDIAEASKDGTIDHKNHLGLKNEKGHIGFLSHDSPVKFRNLRIKNLD
jgi:HEAT repeat protein